jgi:hypothetical protein
VIGNGFLNAHRPPKHLFNGKTDLRDAVVFHFAGDAPLAEKARSFAKARPFASAALVGVAVVAVVLNTLRGARLAFVSH